MKATSAEAMNLHCQPTAWIDSDHPRVHSRAIQLTDGAQTDRERALAIYRFVRDEIPFGWSRSLYAQSASTVLQFGRGYCATKGTLFVALLRAVGIPARLHFVDVTSGLLRGLVQATTPYVDHVYAEVRLDERWIKLDSYILDAPMFTSAVELLDRAGQQTGFGVHGSGVNDWDGIHDSFCQFVDNGSADGFSRTDFGVFDDVASFYRDVDEAWNRHTPLFRILLAVGIPLANRRVERLRTDRT